MMMTLDNQAAFLMVAAVEQKVFVLQADIAAESYSVAHFAHPWICGGRGIKALRRYGQTARVLATRTRRTNDSLPNLRAPTSAI
jgi:hypothetical protein